MIRNLKLIAAFMIAIIGMVLTSTPSFAASHWPVNHPYRFEVVDQNIHAGNNVSVSFRLIQTSTGKVISGAAMTKPTLEMLRQDEEPAPGQIETLGSDSQGNYILKANLPEAGNWELQFYFQIPEEDAPSHGTVMFEVMK